MVSCTYTGPIKVRGPAWMTASLKARGTQIPDGSSTSMAFASYSFAMGMSGSWGGSVSVARATIPGNTTSRNCFTRASPGQAVPDTAHSGWRRW